MIDYSSNTLRKDHDLRQAIGRLKDIASEQYDVDRLLHSALCEVGRLTNSTFAVLLNQYIIDNDQPRYVCLAAQSRDNNHEWSTLDKSGILLLEHNTKAFFEVIVHSRAIVLDKLGLSRLNEFNSQWPIIQQALLIPMAMDKHNQYLICIGNADSNYHSDDAQRLWPLLIHVSTHLRIINANSNSVRSNSQGTQIVDITSTNNNEIWRKIFHSLEKANPVAMITLSEDHTICRINEAAENLFAISANELLKKPIELFLINHTVILQALKNTSATNMLSRIRKGMGGILDVQLNLVHYEVNGAHFDLLLISEAHDSSVNQHSVALALERFQVLASMLPMGILQTDVDWHTEYVNQRWLDITECKIGEVHGLGWMQLFHPEEAEEIIKELHFSISGGREFVRECQLKRGQGYTWAMLHATPIIDKHGVIKGLIATISDFSKQHEAEERLRDLAEKDPLTGLSNRACFFDRLNHALMRVERHGSLALLALDLDGFKHINDTLGHDVGDFILVEVAKRLSTSLRNEDTICRVGGDEFLLIIEGLEDATIIASLAEKLLRILAEPYMIGAKEIFISTSIGISFSVSGRKTTGKNLLKQADLALYRAKDAGRNNYQYYSPELEQASRKKLELTNDLHRALGKQEFEIYYQAQLDTQTNRIRGFEALLRWQHPETGLMSPTEFIPLLEESGLISNVSNWMCLASFKQLKQWIDAELLGPDAVMAVNISPRQFYDEHLVTHMHSATLDANISPANVVIEVTERLLLKEHTLIIKHLEEFHALGFKIALDDFGTGYSSLSYLKKFPIDIIKIDRSFIKDIDTDESDSLITKAVIKLGESLGLTVLAEGVDSEKILSLLKLWHCEEYQGFLINQPLPASKVTALCKKHTTQLNALEGT